MSKTLLELIAVLTVCLCGVFCQTYTGCSCKNFQCPISNSCKELTKDECGCCLVCKRSKGEMCGGHRSIWGKCGEMMKCKYKKFDHQSSRIGTCEKVDTVCLGADTGNFPRQIGESWTSGCYKMTCKPNLEVLKESPMCLDAGCGIRKSMTSRCCRICKRESPRVVCGEDSMLLTIPKSIMSRKAFQKSSLGSHRCQGYQNKTHYYFVTSWTACGTKLKRIGSVYNYTNEVIVRTRKGNTIERTKFTFFCVREHAVRVKSLFHIHQRVVQSGVVMQLTSKGGRLYPKKRGVYLTNQDERMYVSISAPLVKKYKIRMVPNWCVLMTSKKINAKIGTPSYLIIDKGCIVNKQVKVLFKRKDVMWLSIPKLDVSFKKLYLHCNVIICPEIPLQGACAKDCISNTLY